MTTSKNTSDIDQLTHAVSEYQVIDLEVDEPIKDTITVTINRPAARNALNSEVRNALTRIFKIIDELKDIKAVILTGSTEGGSFVAGADISELRERDLLEQRVHSDPPRIYEHIAECSKPVVARINGHALGGGLELALACDIRIADTDAKLGSPEINLGLIPGGGATQRLPQLIGKGQAMRLILTGEIIDAEEARDIGLVEFVADSTELDEVVTDLVSSIADKSSVAVSFAKQAVSSSDWMSLREGIDFEAQLFTQLFATDDKNEGIDAFFEDRDPEWQGR